MPGLLPHPRFMSGVEHLAFTHAKLGDLLATYRRLKGEGIEPHIGRLHAFPARLAGRRRKRA